MSLFTKRTLVQKICILSLLFLTIPTLFFSFYLYKKQTRELHTQLIHEQGIAIEQTTKHWIIFLLLFQTFQEILPTHNP